MNLNDLTIGQARELTSLFGGESKKETPFEVGQNYLIRTVTHIQTGRVDSIKGDFLVLGDAAWVADTGRFNDALTTGELNEVEPFNSPVFVNTGSIIDASEWSHSLPRSQK